MTIVSLLRTLLFVLVWGLLGGLAFQYGGYAPWFVFDALTAALVAQLGVWLGALHRIEVRHELSAAILIEGQEQTVTVRLQHRSWVPVPWLLVEEHWKRSGEDASRPYRKLLFPWLRKTMEYRYTLSGLPRGEYRLARVVAVAGDGVGLLAGRRKSAVLAGSASSSDGEASGNSHSASFLCYPSETPLRIGVGLGADEECRRLPRAFMPFGGSGAYDLRDYAAGDPLSRMHWKATARRGMLTVKEPQPQEGQQVLLLLDNSAATYAALGDAAPEALEASVRAAAGLLRACSERGLALAFACCDGAAPAAAGRGPRGRELLLGRLARVHGKGAVRFADIVAGEAARLPAATRLALVTPCVDEPLVLALRSMQRPQHRVLLAQPHAMPTLAAGERLAALRALGCDVLQLPPAAAPQPPPRAHAAAGRSAHAEAALAEGGAGHVHAGD